VLDETPTPASYRPTSRSRSPAAGRPRERIGPLSTARGSPDAGPATGAARLRNAASARVGGAGARLAVLSADCWAGWGSNRPKPKGVVAVWAMGNLGRTLASGNGRPGWSSGSPICSEFFYF
jgi:hypothetical protein